MSFEVNCGTDEICQRCPFIEYENDIAQKLGRLSACFEGSIPTDTQIERIAELTDTELLEKDPIKIRNSASLFGIGHCRVEDI